MKTKTILIPLDGSEIAEAALAEARQLSDPDSTLVLVRAASALALPGTDAIDAKVYAVQEAEAYLDELKTKLEAWLRDPSKQRPTAHMPTIRLTATEVTALAAYLATLR